MDVFFAAFDVEIEVGDHVHLVDDDEVADGEHEGVFEGFVVAFGHGENHGVAGCAGVELGGTDQVADVFEDNEIDLVKVEVVETLSGHLRIEVAHAAGMQLDGVHAGFLLDLAGIYVAVDVGLHHGHANFVLYPVNQLDKGAGLATAGRRHQVEEEHSFGFQLVAERVGIFLVLGKDALLDFDDFHFVHLCCFLKSQRYNFFLYLRGRNLRR